MLNLSDNELDRLSREAASEYDPGVITNPGAWKKLEHRLDGDLGRIRPNLFRSIRRFPFYYAPALLFLAGISYYLFRPSHSPATAKSESSSGPPAPVLKAIRPAPTNSNQNSITQNNPDKATSTPDKDRSTGDKGSNADAATSLHPDAPASADPSRTHAPDPRHSDVATKDRPSGSAHPNAASPNSAHPNTTRSGNTAYHPSGSNALHPNASNPVASNAAGSNPLRPGTHPSNSGGGLASVTGSKNSNGSKGSKHHGVYTGPVNQGASAATGTAVPSGQGSGSSVASATITAAPTPAYPEPGFSRIQRPGRLTPLPTIDDSGLRNFNPKTGYPVTIDNKNASLHINRSLQFGFSISPDFASVNSLAGDKPGISLGLTVDYQLANRWYISTGLIYTKKNYAASGKDYHAPYDYLRANNMHNVDFVKGTFGMLEIPLNLRYDFSIAGNTSFFATAGFSSYLLTHENCNYYFDMFGRGEHRKFEYQMHPTNLFSTINLSMGAETAISNSVSLLVAPYLKLPAGNIGFGQIQLNSMGINFAVKYAPVLSRKRR